MPRDIPVGNGYLLVCFDREYAIRDLYFPTWARRTTWVDAGRGSGSGSEGASPGWGRGGRSSCATKPTPWLPGSASSTGSWDAARLPRRGRFPRKHLPPRDHGGEHAPGRAGNPPLLCPGFQHFRQQLGDTAAFDPETGGVVHYKGARYFLANAWVSGTDGLAQYAVGQKEGGGREGTWRDAEDGILSGNPIAQGSVDSVIGSHPLPGRGSRSAAYYWLAAGESWQMVRRLDALVKHKQPFGPDQAHRRLLEPVGPQRDRRPLEGLPVQVAELYRRSLLFLQTQIDSAGGILAANDSDVIQFNRDTYCYIWPRDGALVANALDLAGYADAPATSTVLSPG